MVLPQNILASGRHAEGPRLAPDRRCRKSGVLAWLMVASLTTLVAFRCPAQESPEGFLPPEVAEPMFPDHQVSVADFGAVPDGKTLNTEAFAKAVDAVEVQGGGRVVVPPGLWLTGSIRFKSNLDLHVEAGAVIQFTTDPGQFPLTVLEVKDAKNVVTTSPLRGENLENVAITGRGIIDGGGGAWRPVKKSKLTDDQWKQLTGSGGVLAAKGDLWWPNRETMEGGALVAKLRKDKSLRPADYEPAHRFLRPPLLTFVGCRRVLLEGVTFQNSPSWNLHPLLCRDLTIHGVTVRAPWTAQNSDALDLDSCQNVVVRGSSFDVGDDGICLKSGTNEAGRRRDVPTENVLIEDCVVYHGHGGFTIGSEMSGGVHNVRLDNCVFVGTDVGLRFKSKRGRGGVVERIFVSNTRMTNILGDAISFDLFYGDDASPEDAGRTDMQTPPVNEGTPQFRNIHLENITCRGAKTAASWRGLPEMPLRGLHLKNVSITATSGMDWTDVTDTHLENVEVINTTGPAIQIRDTADCSIDHLSFRAGVEAVVVAKGRNNQRFTIRHTDLRSAGRGVVADAADPEQIKVQ